MISKCLLFLSYLSSRAIVLSREYIHVIFLNKAANGELLDLYLKAFSKKILFVKSLVFWKKNETRNEMKFWTFFELATFEANVIWKMQHFFWYCLNTTVCKFNNFNIGTVKDIQKKFVSLDEMGKQFTSSFLLMLLQ